ncbi:MAG: chitobiase/beta-hexosaminidase C-terminal domain-containing protein [Bacteroidales bacterium]|nr:chitobiase/beta-hexosaminidase C-terminal domain-containing protein [Bacteroidales bacterium]
MKRILLVMLLAMCGSAMAQKAVNIGVIPTPQEVSLSPEGKSCVLAKAKVKEQRVKWGRGPQEPHFDGNWSQAYRLTIEPRKITIEYDGAKGLEYARLTLAQLRQLHDTLPCCTILDWPAYKYRGWMDDQSRGPVPHAAYRQKQWQTLHALKYNFCNYYTEHTLYQPEFPDLAPAYLADCTPHPDEVINLQLFAHAEETLRIPFYEDLMDSRANFNPGNPKVYNFLRQRIAAAFKRIPNSPFFIINCDETEQLGTGRAKKIVERKGADQVYVDHINRCNELVKAAGDTRVVMWGDIVAKNPDMMRQLPDDITYIMWAYEPLESYDHLIKPFKENGTPFWVAPSLSHSSNMIPNPYRYMKNIANLARDGFLNGAEGLMNTCWDDNGEALFDNCWHGLFWSAEMAWNPIKTNDPEEFKSREQQFNENFERLFYGRDPKTPTQFEKEQPFLFNNAPSNNPAIGYTADLYAVGALESDPDVADWYTTAPLMEPLLNFNPENTSNAISERIGRVHDKIRPLLDRIDSTANPHAYYALHRIQVTHYKYAYRRLIYRFLNEDEPSLPMRLQMMKHQYMIFLTELKNEYLRLWDQENGDYERQIVMNRYNDLAREVLELDRHVFMETENGERKTENGYPMVTLRTLYDDRPIYYTLDGSEPNKGSTLYTEPFPLERSATIKAITYNEYDEGVITEQYLLSHKAMGAKITLNTKYSDYKAIYSGGGPNALIDGQLGSSTTYADGHWQGYWGDSIDAIIDFGKPTEIHEVTMRFMQNTFDWILAPNDIILMVSDDGEHWTIQVNWPAFNFPARETGMRLRYCTVPIFKGVTTRYLRVVVPNPGTLPSWHPAPGQPSYLFTDEIIIK